jgi:hypothetical protein
LKPVNLDRPENRRSRRNASQSIYETDLGTPYKRRILPLAEWIRKLWMRWLLAEWFTAVFGEDGRFLKEVAMAHCRPYSPVGRDVQKGTTFLLSMGRPKYLGNEPRESS